MLGAPPNNILNEPISSDFNNFSFGTKAATIPEQFFVKIGELLK